MIPRCILAMTRQADQNFSREQWNTNKCGVTICFPNGQPVSFKFVPLPTAIVLLRKSLLLQRVNHLGLRVMLMQPCQPNPGCEN